APPDDGIAALEAGERRQGVELRRGPLEHRAPLPYPHGGREAESPRRGVELLAGAAEAGQRPAPLETRSEPRELAAVPGELARERPAGAAGELVDPERGVAEAPGRIAEPAVERGEALAALAGTAGERAAEAGLGPCERPGDVGLIGHDERRGGRRG